MSEELFQGVLIRERKRADRSNSSFALMLVSVGSPDRPDEHRSTWSAIIDALTTSKRETDVVGWFAGGSALGVIFSEMVSREADVRAIQDRVRRALETRLSGAAAASLSIRLHVHPELDHAREIPPLDPLLGTLSPRPHRGTAYAALKRGLDLIGSGLLLLVLSPLFLLIGIVIKLGSKGPVFFRQPRIGQSARPFTMFKFRTMHEGADHQVHQDFVTRFITSSADLDDGGEEAPFKIANDPRVTPVGQLLRKTSLDELPQLLNVFRGEMSLVGPRPPLSYEVERYQSWHHRRVLEMKPGITGLWQVGGRSRTTFDEMVRLDLRYAKTCSLWTDIKILLKTPAAVISGKGAR